MQGRHHNRLGSNCSLATLFCGPLNALKSGKWNAEAKYGRFDASYIEEGRTKGAEVCSLHNYSKLQCFLPIEEGEAGPQPPAL